MIRLLKQSALVIFYAIISFSLFAQAEPSAILEYFDDSLEIQVITSDGEMLDDIYFGMELALGDSIKTNGTSAEIRLDPNGSIIKLSSNTEFVIETLEGKNNEASNSFALLTGKIRAIAASTGVYTNYSVNTPSAVCGVRGTDFGLEAIPGERDVAAVLQGKVEFKNLNTGKVIELNPGNYADVFAPTFEAIQVPISQLEAIFNTMSFQKLNPDSVPGHGKDILKSVPSDTADRAEKVTKEDKDGGGSELLNALGLEIGTITIEGETYSKVVLQPNFSIGKLEASLYLPVIYQENLFDPDDWYKPKGNDEWSFGNDKHDTGSQIADALTDLALKIHYLKYGERRDPFYLALGNLNDMTIGHGTIMYNYANDQDFPAVRKVGVNLGIDRKNAGIEGVVNNLAEPEIMGGRLYFRPFSESSRFAVGLTGIVDTNPAAEKTETEAETNYGDPMFIAGGLDLDIPVVESSMLSIVLFGDGAVMAPYYRTEVEIETEDEAVSGLYANFLWDDDKQFGLRNYAAKTGVFGNFLMVDYELDYRISEGVMTPGLFGSMYERERTYYLDAMKRYVNNPELDEFNKQKAGVFGSAGFDLGKYLAVKAGYLYPWEYVDGKKVSSDEDYFTLKAELKKGAIPFYDVYASLSYQRKYFYKTISDGEMTYNGSTVDLSLFDAFSTVKGEAVVPITDTIDIAVTVSTSVAYDDDGNIVMDGENLPEMNTTIGIETRVSF